MTKEEIEKYIQPGCKIKFNSGDEIYIVYKYYPDSIYIYGYNCSFGIDCIKEIVSWPVPDEITSGWIKFKEPGKNDPWTIQFVTPMDEYVDQWHPVSRTISNYPCIPRRQEHLNLRDRIPDWKIKKDWITDWRPIPPLGKLLLKDCPTFSFVRLKTKIGVHSPWNHIANKSPTEVIVYRDDAEGYADPESEVIDIIEKLEDIPSHALVRKRHTPNFIPVEQFLKEFGKFAEIAAIITEPSKQNKPPLNENKYTSKDIKPGWWVKIADADYVRKVASSKTTFYFYSDEKIANEAGKWIQVRTVSSSNSGIATEKYAWDQEFIVDISPTNPNLNCKVPDNTENATASLVDGNVIAIKNNTCKNTTLQITYDEANSLSWDQMNELFTRATTPTTPHWYYNHYEKQEKETIMLNTVEDIKKLDEANLKEASRKVKEERDNDEVKAAREKLTHLLNCESDLKTRKEKIDKELAQVQELIRAFGYPPKDAK